VLILVSCPRFSLAFSLISRLFNIDSNHDAMRAADRPCYVFDVVVAIMFRAIFRPVGRPQSSGLAFDSKFHCGPIGFVLEGGA
jgi:hypothetical protein